MLNNFLRILFVAAVTLSTACGTRTSIQTGEVGRILGNNGLQDEILYPGVFRLDICGTSACPKLVRLQVNKSTTELTIDSLFLPKSNVDIKNVKVGVQFQVKQDEASYNTIYAEVRPEEVEKQVLLITAEQVYTTFLARKAPDAIVTALRNQKVEDVLTNVPEIAKATKDAINKMLSEAPIEVTELGFPNGIGEVPEEVINAKRLLFAVDEEKAREIKALAAALEIEDQRQAVQRKRVHNDVANAKIAGVKYDVYVALKNFERFADAAEAGTPVALGGQYITPSK